jgi:hypothetical protein
LPFALTLVSPRRRLDLFFFYNFLPELKCSSSFDCIHSFNFLTEETEWSFCLHSDKSWKREEEKWCSTKCFSSHENDFTLPSRSIGSPSFVPSWPLTSSMELERHWQRAGVGEKNSRVHSIRTHRICCWKSNVSVSWRRKNIPPGETKRKGSENHTRESQERENHKRKGISFLFHNDLSSLPYFRVVSSCLSWMCSILKLISNASLSSVMCELCVFSLLFP